MVVHKGDPVLIMLGGRNPQLSVAIPMYILHFLYFLISFMCIYIYVYMLVNLHMYVYIRVLGNFACNLFVGYVQFVGRLYVG